MIRSVVVVDNKREEERDGAGAERIYAKDGLSLAGFWVMDGAVFYFGYQGSDQGKAKGE